MQLDAPVLRFAGSAGIQINIAFLQTLKASCPKLNQIELAGAEIVGTEAKSALAHLISSHSLQVCSIECMDAAEFCTSFDPDAAPDASVLSSITVLDVGLKESRHQIQRFYAYSVHDMQLSWASLPPHLSSSFVRLHTLDLSYMDMPWEVLSHLSSLITLSVGAVEPPVRRPVAKPPPVLQRLVLVGDELPATEVLQVR